jgi:hypothetical protein
VTWKGYE